MYIINVRPPINITPRIFAVEFERPSGRLAFSFVLLAMCPRHALDQVTLLFPELRRSLFQGNVCEVSYVAIDWQVRMAFVIRQGRTRPPMLLMDAYGRDKQATGAAGSRPGREDHQE